MTESTNSDNSKPQAEVPTNNQPTETIPNQQDRQDLIETAVRFLKNPKVVPTPLESKRLFLSKKGLTDSEINIAFKRADCYDQATNSSSTTAVVQAKPNENTKEIKKVENKPSFWFRLFRLARNLILAGCLTFTAYKLIVKKYLLNKSKVQKAIKTELLIESINEIKDSLNLLKNSIETMNNSVRQINLQKVNSSSNVNPDDLNLRSELQSIKNLLLSRTQFPSLPTITPVIPSWQLETRSSVSPKESKASIDDSLNKEDNSNNINANSDENNSQ